MSKTNKTKSNFNWAIWICCCCFLLSLKNAFLRVHNRAAITFLKLMIIWPVVCLGEWVSVCVCVQVCKFVSVFLIFIIFMFYDRFLFYFLFFIRETKMVKSFLLLRVDVALQM